MTEWGIIKLGFVIGLSINFVWHVCDYKKAHPDLSIAVVAHNVKQDIKSLDYSAVPNDDDLGDLDDDDTTT